MPDSVRVPGTNTHADITFRSMPSLTKAYGGSTWMMRVGDRNLAVLVEQDGHLAGWMFMIYADPMGCTGPHMVRGFASRRAAAEYALDAYGYGDRPFEPKTAPLYPSGVVETIVTALRSHVGPGQVLTVDVSDPVTGGTITFTERGFSKPLHAQGMTHHITVASDIDMDPLSRAIEKQGVDTSDWFGLTEQADAHIGEQRDGQSDSQSAEPTDPMVSAVAVSAASTFSD